MQRLWQDLESYYGVSSASAFKIPVPISAYKRWMIRTRCHPTSADPPRNCGVHDTPGMGRRFRHLADGGLFVGIGRISGVWCRHSDQHGVWLYCILRRWALNGGDGRSINAIVFGRYVSPQVVEALLESGKRPRRGGQTQTVTVCCSPTSVISTTISERLGPR